MIKDRKFQKKESLGSDIDKYQMWVDYDMKRYGRISDITNKYLRDAGLTVVKDEYGDYEVIAKSEESCKESVRPKRIVTRQPDVKDKTTDVKEKLEKAKARKEIQERIANYKRSKEIKERLERAKRRRQIQERISNLRKQK